MTNSILAPISFTSFFDGTDGEVIQADVYFYVGGTTSPTTVYHDAGLNEGWEQPIRTTGYGRFPPIFIPEIESYRIMVYDLDGVLLEDADGLVGAFPDPATVPPEIEIDSNGLVSTGDIIASFAHPDTTRAGFVRCNGRVIGPAGILGSVERGNPDTQDLFIFLWEQSGGMGGTDLQVYTGAGAPTTRGPTAIADWGAGKSIALPDLRGRVIAGLDGMGHTAALRLSTSYFGVTGLYSGHAGGNQAHTLTAAQLATHAHPFTVNWLYQNEHYHNGYNTNDHTHTQSWQNSVSQNGGFGVQPTGIVTNGQITGSTFYNNGVAVNSGVTASGGISNSITIQTYPAQPAINSSFTVNNMTGGDNAHANVQPTMVMMFYMRL